MERGKGRTKLTGPSPSDHHKSAFWTIRTNLSPTRALYRRLVHDISARGRGLSLSPACTFSNLGLVKGFWTAGLGIRPKSKVGHPFHNPGLLTLNRSLVCLPACPQLAPPASLLTPNCPSPPA
uniref:Uncharacterized protein n=1 Tax=Pipistrellus kuhlii TaxID=59472 RepID=A0A7J8A8I5_PIPKU|nr:hypothetical protein mPipKuh1_008931 [Pipistrellus kuhlii]